VSEEVVKIGKNRSKYQVQIPCKMFSSFYQEDLLNTLSYYVQIRTLYKNPIIYNCNKRKLAEKLGVSYNTLKFHLNILVDKGIVHLRDGNICVLTKKKLQKIYPSFIGKYPDEKSITIYASKKLSETKISIRGILFVAKLRYQEKRLNISVERQILTSKSVLRPLNKKDTERLDKLKKYERKTEYGYLTVSNKNIAKSMDRRSETTAKKYKKLLKTLGYINWRRRFELIKPEERHLYYDGFFGCINGSRIDKNGILIKETTSQFKLRGKKFINHKLSEFKLSYSSYDLDKLDVLTTSKIVVIKLTPKK